MKNMVFLIIWVLPLFTSAQNSALNDLFEKYSGKEGGQDPYGNDDFDSLHIHLLRFTTCPGICNRYAVCIETGTTGVRLHCIIAYEL